MAFWISVYAACAAGCGAGITEPCPSGQGQICTSPGACVCGPQCSSQSDCPSGLDCEFTQAGAGVCVSPSNSCQALSGSSACADSTYVYCGSLCCPPQAPYYCASTNSCYQTQSAASAKCGSSCVACVRAVAVANACTTVPCTCPTVHGLTSHESPDGTNQCDRPFGCDGVTPNPYYPCTCH
jgi:hypothetical protein